MLPHAACRYRPRLTAGCAALPIAALLCVAGRRQSGTPPPSEPVLTRQPAAPPPEPPPRDPRCAGGPAVWCERAAECERTAYCASVPQSALPALPRGKGQRRRWLAAQGQLRAAAQSQGSAARLVLYGDSIVEALRGTEMGQSLPLPHLAPHPAAFQAAAAAVGGLALGLAGDPTQHLLWRLRHGGESSGLHPEAAILIVGTNNLGLYRQSASDTAAGIAACASLLCALLPGAAVLVVGVLPRADCQHRQWTPCTPGRPWERVQQTNAELRGYLSSPRQGGGCGKQARYVDCSEALLRQASGAGRGGEEMDPSASADALHPNATGWRHLWTCLRRELRAAVPSLAADLRDMG
eukprot:TRINITY_DN14198_c0_g1_i3.p1 TRINITY_DN14198_c0_g1~~TRINITY_DN14198_c0_g1_i3.p1  ORF type:complete len:352 (+),score=33.70 TRINITY_DN14198_c0_g1_i3:108-1163(+)